MSDLEGKVALVTGAGRGIGRAIATVLAHKGMLIGVNDIDETLAENVAKTLGGEGGRALALPASVGNKTDVAGIFDQIESELGPLWLLVNNAGVLPTGPTAELSEEAWDDAFEVDAKGVFLCSQAAIRKMIPRRQGRIVNISSVAGMIVRIAEISYCSAKAAVIHFSRCLAVEMAPYGITVNCVCPGMTSTEMLNKSVVDRGLDLDAMVELIPDGRMAKEEEHAHLVAYFASEEAAHVTGQVVAVDGAQSLYLPFMMKH
ncbi:MAG: SDR family NAD(P)-dependent oxidoreductase [Anaerolineales bacterium]|jgi:NAD(P)-dependent dehydrogenase (short-subunit alcohol dehydrogenase family)